MGRLKHNSIKYNFRPSAATRSLRMVWKGISTIFFALLYIVVGVGWLTVWVLLLLYRIPRYMWRFKWGRTWLLGMLLVLSIYLAGLGVKMYLAERAGRLDAERQALLLTQELVGAKEANNLLYAKMEQTQKDRGRHISVQAKEYISNLVCKYFNSDCQEALQVFKCESGLSPFNVNDKNKPGLGIDGGVAQINERWHKERFEKMYGVPYEIGIYNPDLNLQYAKYLKEHSGWGAWVCGKIVGVVASK